MLTTFCRASYNLDVQDYKSMWSNNNYILGMLNLAAYFGLYFSLVKRPKIIRRDGCTGHTSGV